MKTRTLLLPILLLTALLSGCSSESQPAEPKAKILADGAEHIIIGGEPIWPADAVRFEVEQVFGTDEDQPESMLAQARFLDVDDNGNLYVFDGKDNNLIKFNKEGDLIWRVGEEGQGPEDFMFVMGMMLNSEGNVYVLNQMAKRIDIWNPSGEMIHSASLGFETSNATMFVDITDENQIMLSAVNTETADYIYQIISLQDDVYQIADEFEIERHVEPQLGNMFISPLSSNNNQLTAMMFIDSLIVDRYTFSGKRTQRVQLGKTVISPTGVIRGENGQFGGAMGFGYRQSPVMINDRLILWQYSTAEGINTQNDADQAVANMMSESFEFPKPIFKALIYDEAGKLLWNIQTEDKTHLAALDIQFVDHNGALYVRTDDPFPQIQRVRLITPEL